MNTSNSNTAMGMIITLVLVAAIALVVRMAGSTFAGAFLLVAAIVLAVFILLVILISVFSIGVGKSDRQKTAAYERGGELPGEVKAADHVMLNIIAVTEAVHNPEVKAEAQKLLEQCRMINSIATKQPDELYKAEEFFHSWLPMFLAMMESYISQELSGSPDLTGRVLTCMDNLAVLFDRQYRAFFTTEVFDMSNEARALEAALKKNRLC